MKKEILLGLFLALSFSNVWANAWAAIAINKETGRAGYSYGHSSQSNAEGRALRECPGKCVLATSFYNSCGAVAWAPKTDSKYNFGYATGVSSSANALKTCRGIPGAQGCQVVVSFCSTY